MFSKKKKNAYKVYHTKKSCTDAISFNVYTCMGASKHLLSTCRRKSILSRLRVLKTWLYFFSILRGASSRSTFLEVREHFARSVAITVFCCSEIPSRIFLPYLRGLIRSPFNSNVTDGSGYEFANSCVNGPFVRDTLVLES